MNCIPFMILAIPKESYLEEKRVAIAPENVPAFFKLGYEVRIQSGAGEAAQMSDSSYQQEGAEIIDEVDKLWSSADLILKVNPQP